MSADTLTAPPYDLAATGSPLTVSSMPSGTLLVLEASTSAGSVAVVRDGQLLAHANVAMGASRDDLLFPAAQRLLAECDIMPMALSGIVCGAGPGSFTSLRIAGSLAKGLAHGGGVSLYAVPSLLLALAAEAQDGADAVATGESPAGDWVVHGDALRGERYVLRARVDAHRRVFALGTVQRVPFAELPVFGGEARRLAVGASTAPELETAICAPDARGVLALGDWASCGPVPLADWEPQYGRLAEAQVVWEQKHGHALPAS